MFGNLILLRPNNHDGGVFPIMKQSLKLGRDPACQIQLRMPLVSRFHCCIAIDPPTGNVLYITQAYVSDTSANGTAVNGVPLRKTQLLEHGDHICIGERKFRFEYPLDKIPVLKDGESVDALQDWEPENVDPTAKAPFETPKKQKHVGSPSASPRASPRLARSVASPQLVSTTTKPKQASLLKDIIVKNAKKSLVAKSQVESSVSMDMPASQTANPIAVVQEDNATFAQIKNFDEEIESLNHIISHDHESEANELVHPEIEILAETTCSVQIGKAVDRIISLQDDKTVYQRASVEPAEIVDQDIGSQVRGNVSPIASLDPSEAVTMSIGIDQQIDAFTQVSYSGQESVVAQVVSTQKETEMQGQDAEIPSSESLAESQESMSGVVVHDVHPLLSTESPARQMESQTKSSDALQSPSTMFTTSAIDQIGGEISLVASQSPAQRSVIVANTLPNYLQDTQASASKRALRSANKAPRTPSSSRAKTAQSAKRPGNLQSLLENVSVKKSRTAPTTQHSSPRSSKQLDQIKPASFLSTEMFWRELDSFVKTAAPAVPVDKNTSATLAERFAYTPTDPAKKSASPVPAPRTPALSGSPRTVSFGPPLSPEIFDTTRPASTPVTRGRISTVSNTIVHGSPIRSALKSGKGKRLPARTEWSSPIRAQMQSVDDMADVHIENEEECKIGNDQAQIEEMLIKVPAAEIVVEAEKHNNDEQQDAGMQRSDLVNNVKVASTDSARKILVMDELCPSSAISDEAPKPQQAAPPLHQAQEPKAASNAEVSSVRFYGVSRLFQTPKKEAQALTNLVGVSNLLSTPKPAQQTPRLGGVKRMLRTPAQRIVKTPAQREPDYSGVASLLKSRTRVGKSGIQGTAERVQKTPKAQSEVDYQGVSSLMKTKKRTLTSELGPSGEQDQPTSPLADKEGTPASSKQPRIEGSGRPRSRRRSVKRAISPKSELDAESLHLAQIALKAHSCASQLSGELGFFATIDRTLEQGEKLHDVLVDGDRAQQTVAASVMEGGMEAIASDEGIEQVETPARKTIHEADAVRGTDMVSTTPTLQSTKGSARRQSGRASQLAKLVVSEDADKLSQFADEPAVDVGASKQELDAVVSEGANISTTGEVLELQTFAASETETDHELPIVADNSVAEATTPTRKDIDESDVLVDGDRAQQTAAASVMEGGMESIASDEGIEQVETPARKSIHEADAVRGTDMVSTTPTLQSTKGSARRQSRRASQLAKLAVSEDADKLSQFADEPAVDVGASKQELDAVVSEGANISTTGEVLELQTFAASETETDHELPIVADNSVAEATTPTRKDIDESDVLVDGDRAQQTAAASVMEGGMESIASDEGIEQVETPARKSIHEADAVRGTDMVSTTPTLQSTQGSARRQSGRASQPIKLVALEFCGGMPLVADEPPVEVDVTKKEDNEIIFDSANIATIGDTLETLADEIAEETAIDLAINAEVDVPSMAQDATEAVLDKKKVALELDQAEDTKENDQVVEVAAEINDSHGADTVEYADVAHTDEETVDILQPVPASKQADVGQHAEVHEEDVLMFENHDEELQIAPSSAMKQAESEQVDSDDDMISAADEIAAPEIFKAKRGRPLKKSVDKQVAQPEKPKRGSKKAMNDEAVAVFAQESEKHSENSVDNTSDLPKRSGRSTRAHDQLEMVESNVDIPQAETTFAEPTKKTGRTKDSIPSESVNSSATIAKKKGAKSTSSKQSAADITHVELEVIEESAVVIKKAGRSKKARVAKDVPAESANVAEVEMKAVENSADVTKKAAPAKKSHSAEVVGQESAAEIKDGTEDEAEAVVKIATVTKKTSRTKKSQPVKSAPAPSETAGESDIANEVEAVEKIAAVTKKAARAKKSQPAKEIVAAEIEIESDDEAEAVEKVLAVTKKAGRSKKAHPANVVPTETVEETEMNYEPEVAEKVAVTKKAARTKKTQPAIPVAEESAVQSEAGMKNEEKDVLVAKKPGRGRKSHASKAVSAEPVAAVATADTDVEDKPAAKKGRSKKSKSADVADLETENEPVLAKPKPLGSKKTTAVISGEALIEPVKAPKKGRRALAARNEQSEDESEQFGQKTEPEAPAIRRARSTRARN